MGVTITDKPTKMKYLVYAPKDPFSFVMFGKYVPYVMRCATLRLARREKRILEDALKSDYFQSNPDNPKAKDFFNTTWVGIYKLEKE
ncbi:hypothetical protein Dip510_001633 [Elusimicrobium posterum]|uniref:hypothetical protein n=1 Tax=Elusimicrobium posterum TaxID=3116653 RepID=UPI003C783CE1